MGFRDRFKASAALQPWLVGLLAGLYPILFYASNNYGLVNSWGHFWFFVGVFLALPIALGVMGLKLLGWTKTRAIQKYYLPFLGLGLFLFFIKMTLLEAPHRKITLVIILVSALYSFLLGKHHKKIMVIQFLMALMGGMSFSAQVFHHLNLSQQWKEPIDDITEITLQDRPNIYLLQPDGLVNFSELSQGYYQMDATAFQEGLTARGFSHYDDFRTNYASTLSSNSSLLMMRHHYYNNGKSFSEAIDGRESIISENQVLTILRRNGYESHFISESPYLLANHPKLGFDTANFSYKAIGYLSQGFNLKAEVQEDLVKVMDQQGQVPQFYFVQFFNPGHIHSQSSTSLGRDKEADLWQESMQRAQVKINDLVGRILERDPEALIMIMGDHGGFVGLNYTNEIYQKTQDRDLIYSIFSSQLSIRWPQQLKPEVSIPFTTSVNVFRLLFAHLGHAPKYAQNLAPDASFVILEDETHRGVYEYLNDQGQVVCEKH